jgi:hypothetical protein
LAGLVDFLTAARSHIALNRHPMEATMFGVDTLVPLGFFAMISFIAVGLTKVIFDGRVRRRLIETNATPELARAIMGTAQNDPELYGALKWGILTGAIGLALIVIQFLPYRPDDPIMLGVILVFAAGGLLGYYVIARRMASHSVASGPR